MNLNLVHFNVYISFFVASILALGQPPILSAAEPQLTIHYKEKSTTFTRSTLLKHPHLTSMTTKESPAFAGSQVTFAVVPLYLLFKDFTIPKDATIEFQCEDGYSSPIAKERVLNRSLQGSIAYLAIEEEGKPWPLITKANASHHAGPFYLVWKNPAASKIDPYEWPLQLASFTIKPPLREAFPAIFPDSKLAPNHGVKRGFAIFTRTCLPCHTLNLQGSSALGPDLNIPLNPTEYFKPAALKLLLRNPQSLRRWPQGKMPAFSAQTLPDAAIDDVIAYLQHMARRKVQTPRR